MSTKVSITAPAPVGAWDASVVTCLELTRERSQTDTEYKMEWSNVVLMVTVICLIEGGNCGRWLMFGGYQDVEGGPDTTPLDSVELVTLDQESKETISF